MRFIHLIPLLSLTPQVIAWGAAGHEITATIAELYLHPSARDALCSILPDYAKCHLAPIASWADKVKRFMRWSSQLHYANGVGDHPATDCVFGQQGWEGKPGINVLGGIQNTSTWMREGKDGTEEALKFFVHFMGDLHQPLHLTGRNKGGNNDKVHWDHRQQKFHAVWDSFLISKAIRTVPRNYTSPLPNSHVESVLSGAIYDPYIRQIVWEGLLGQWADDIHTWIQCADSMSPLDYGSHQVPLSANKYPTDDSVTCPYFWAAPIHALNCEIVWPHELDSDDHPAIELDTPEYFGRIHSDRLVERLLAMAGVRTAAVLNSIFGKDGGLLATEWTL